MELGIFASLMIILFLEAARYLRTIKKNNNEIKELKDRIAELETLLKK